MALTLVIITIITLLIALFLRIKNNKRPKGFPPGPTPLPILGNLHQIGLEPYKSFVKLGKKYGGIFSVDYGSYRSVVVNDLKLMKQCLNNPAFSGRPKFRVFLERFGPNAKFTRGIVLTDGHIWTEHRRFVIKNLRDFGFGKSSMEGVINEEIQELLSAMRNMIGKPITTRGLFNMAVVNSLWRICTGIRMSHDDPKLKRLIEDIIEAISACSPISFFFPIITKLFPNLSGFNTVIHGTQSVERFITEAYEEHKSSLIHGKPRDLLDVMIEEVDTTTDSNSSFYKEDGKLNVIHSLLDLFTAGSETTSTTLSWIFLLMAMYPEMQVKLHAEIDKVVGPSRRPELVDRQRMPYTECVFMEVVRFVALLPLSVIHSATEDVNVAGFTIPKGTVFTPNLYAVLHDEGIWGDPEVFRPERFLLLDGTANKSHEAFIPFSYGKRICIGEKLARDEIFLFTTCLFQRFRVKLNSKSAKPSLKPRPTLVLCPNPHELVLEERA